MSDAVRIAPAGLAAGRYLRAIAAGKGFPDAALAIAEGDPSWRTTPAPVSALKAAVSTVTVGGSGAPVVEGPLAQDFIQLVKPRSIVDRIVGYRRVRLAQRVLATTTAAAGYQIGEAAAKIPSAAGFRFVATTPIKLVAMCVESDEVRKLGGPIGDVALATELARAVAQATNVAFIDQAQPTSVTRGAQTIDSTGSTASAIGSDLRTLIDLFADNDEVLDSLTLVMPTKTATYFASLTGSGGAPLFPNINLRTGGYIWGVPVLLSASLKRSGSPGESQIVAVDASRILMSDENEIQLDASIEGTMQMVDAPVAGATSQVSLFQNNLISMRAERYIGWLRVDDSAVAVLDGVNY